MSYKLYPSIYGSEAHGVWRIHPNSSSPIAFKQSLHYLKEALYAFTTKYFGQIFTAKKDPSHYFIFWKIGLCWLLK